MPALDFTDRKSSDELENLPLPTNKGLEDLFVDVDRIVVKEGGVYNEKAISDKIVLTLNAAENVKRLSQLLEINEACIGFYCMCAGTYAIELYAGEVRRTTIGFHHGVSIRYDLWRGDAALKQNDQLLAFLAQQGLAKPLEDWLESKRQSEEAAILEKDWLDNAPSCFRVYWKQMIGFDNDYFLSLAKDLASELPDPNTRIVALLQSYGHTKNFWTAYPSYEKVPYDLLVAHGFKEVIEAYLCSDRNYKTRRGLGRFLCCYDSKKVRRKYYKYLPDEAIDEIEKCFEAIGEQAGVEEISRLRNDKKGRL